MSETPRRDETEHDARLAALYRAADRDEPSPALDAAIRAAAHREVGARPRPAGSPSSPWRVPLSIAAVVLLSASLVALIREEAPEIARPPRAAAPLPPPEAATYPRKESVAADRIGAGRLPTPLAKRASPEAFPGAPVMRDNQVAAPAEKPGRSAKEETRRDVAAVPAEARQQRKAAKPDRAVEAVASVPPPLAAPAEASAQAAGAAIEAKAQPAPLMAGAIQSYLNLLPEKWLERIEELRKQGRLDEARTSLAEFKQRYPDYPLPVSLKDGIKP